VVATEALNRDFGQTKSLSLTTVRLIGQRCKFDGLKKTVNRVLDSQGDCV